MERIWAPWRIEYIACPKEPRCILCQKPEESNDQQNLILYRGQYNFLIMNAYPYNPGHLMVAPYQHTADLQDLSHEQIIEHFELVKKGVEMLKLTLKPAGFNIGLNLGKVAGAGIEGHLHTHIVPRWQGDTNFMPVLSDTKVVSEGLAATYVRLKANFT
jgi:ATP adenylyltransferase